MLRLLNKIKGFTLDAQDGEIGRVEDFYFDDHRWVVRYMVARTGNWLTGRRVLIAPVSLGEPDWDRQALPVRLSREQIRQSPPIETDEPVNRQKESILAQYYGWPMYWMPGYTEPYPRVPAGPPDHEPEQQAQRGDPNLRSCHEVSGYRIHAEDGEIGHVEDYVVMTADWGIRYLLVDTRNWLPGKKVLVSPLWISGVSWPREEVFVRMRRQTIREAPEFDIHKSLTRQFEKDLQEYYRKNGGDIEDQRPRQAG